MVVCPEPPAARIGGEILACGGNAVDAAIATAFAQGVANPLLCGLSGTAILLHRDAHGRTTVLNGECAIGSGAVPRAWIDTLAGRTELIGRYVVADDDNQIGAPSVMVPGFVACCWELFHRLGSGRLSWAALLEPAIRLARDGFAVYPYIADTWAPDGDGQAAARPGYPTLRAKLARDPAANAIYLKPGSQAYAVGDVLVQPAYARTLDQLARAGGDDFYRGAIGRAMADDLARRGSLATADDIAGYRVVEQPALAARYRDYDVLTTPPPSPGVQILEMLALCERLGVGDRDLPATLDTIAQIMRAAFIDNRNIKAVLLDDAASWAARMLDPQRIAAWAARIGAGERIGGAAERQSVGTTHLVVRDEAGAMLSFTHSIGSVAGSGAVTPELGFLHNNFLGHFDPRPGNPMSILPGRRIGSGAPTILTRDGAARLVLGAPGGSRIITAIFQVLLHVVDYGMPVDAAVAALRFHSEEGSLVHLEPGWPDATRDALAASGCTVQNNRYQARVQAIGIAADGTLVAGADPRGGAVARA
jgi:gamma-glutamyltranspeptidase/glutathione hydrolase